MLPYDNSFEPLQFPAAPPAADPLTALAFEIRTVRGLMSEIARSIPLQRRALSEATRNLHVNVTLETRAGRCPCCQRVKVCSLYGRLEGAEYDHWYGRHRNGPEETWLVCSSCNRQLENPAFKTAMRGCFEAYQIALRWIVEDEKQGCLFE